MSTLTQAQLIAGHLWYAGGPRKTPEILYGRNGETGNSLQQGGPIQKGLEIRKGDIDRILKSPEYLVAVKHLMIISRTPKRRKEWIENWDGKLTGFAKRMALSVEDASDIMDEVRQITYSQIALSEGLGVK